MYTQSLGRKAYLAQFKGVSVHNWLDRGRVALQRTIVHDGQKTAKSATDVNRTFLFLLCSNWAAEINVMPN